MEQKKTEVFQDSSKWLSQSNDSVFLEQMNWIKRSLLTFLTLHIMTGAGVSHVLVCDGHLDSISFTCGKCFSFSSSCCLRTSSSLRFGRGHGFTVRPVTQCRHADPNGQDDQSQEEEKPGGRVEAEPTTYYHNIGASFPLSKWKVWKENRMDCFWRPTVYGDIQWCKARLHHYSHQIYRDCSSLCMDRNTENTVCFLWTVDAGFL